MKLLVIALAALAMAGSPPACNKQKSGTICYKGRMEDRGMCGNYTVSVLEGDLPGAAASWQNEQTGKTYGKVFRPANACAVPASIKTGDTFYFTVDTAATDQCNQCMAFYPAPAARINIRVQEGGCGN